jgi:hypothetical protein
MKLTGLARQRAVDELYEASKAHVLENGADAFDWHSFGACMGRVSVNLPSGRNRKGKRCRWERIPGRKLDAFSAYLVRYYPDAPGPCSWLADLARVLDVTSRYFMGMMHGTICRENPCHNYTPNFEYQVGIADGQELYARVEAFIALGRNGR